MSFILKLHSTRNAGSENLATMSSIKFHSAVSKGNTLSIDSKQQSIKVFLTALRFIDKDTRLCIIYVPSIEMSCYGESESSANDMLDETLKYFLKFLLDLPNKQLLNELLKLGWKKNSPENKDFSMPSATIEKKTKDLNAEGKIVRIALVV